MGVVVNAKTPLRNRSDKTISEKEIALYLSMGMMCIGGIRDKDWTRIVDDTGKPILDNPWKKTPEECEGLARPLAQYAAQLPKKVLERFNQLALPLSCITAAFALLSTPIQAEIKLHEYLKRIDQPNPTQGSGAIPTADSITTSTIPHIGE